MFPLVPHFLGHFFMFFSFISALTIMLLVSGNELAWKNVN